MLLNIFYKYSCSSKGVSAFIFLLLTILLAVAQPLCSVYSADKATHGIDPVLPFRLVKGESSDPCHAIHLSAALQGELERFIRSEEDQTFFLPLNSVPPAVLVEYIQRHLEGMSKNPLLSEWVREQARIQRAAICSHYLGLLPDTGLNLFTFSRLHSSYLYEEDGDRMVFLPYETPHGFLASPVNFRAISIIIEVFSREGQGVLPDRFFIDRLELILTTAQQITRQNAVLELAAGDGIVARELHKRCIWVVATDDRTQPPVFDANRHIVPWEQIKVMNAGTAILHLNNYRTTLVFNIGDMKAIHLATPILSTSGPRMFIFSGASVNALTDQQLSELRRQLEYGLPSKLVHVKRIKAAVPLLSSYKPFIAILADDISHASQWPEKLKKMNDMSDAVEKLLQQQISKNPTPGLNVKPAYRCSLQ